ncbi:Thioredoxin [Pediococcus damnosus]|uniref:Thioredoxin n=1 Tax=Pediococcus damnosus TaxID=51663 RepID=A0A0R2HVS9_9LACO|nr:thioredoxin family protein [Pediococcus damnosus]AMV60567.1 Thioredoxin [Pediococcus damnosus]AMV62973.1 Thioredoxin [Pediococcus damnosus]AMV64882.1 Thioredoxin [Pediococcus damnosus]AMV67139.1 Thioredoxin [Pediococcus damnosus]AMV69257.1 Thioredoxin [Pediococcus damnosus]
MDAQEQQLTDQEILDTIKTGKKMLFFTAGWCPDCSFIKPVMPEIEAEYNQYDWVTVDRDANIKIAQKFGVMGIPSFIALEDGEEIGRFVNGDRKTRQEVENFVDSIEK